MLDKLKADFDGIIELVNKTPVPLQEIAAHRARQTVRPLLVG